LNNKVVDTSHYDTFILPKIDTYNNIESFTYKNYLHL